MNAIGSVLICLAVAQGDGEAIVRLPVAKARKPDRAVVARALVVLTEHRLVRLDVEFREKVVPLFEKRALTLEELATSLNLLVATYRKVEKCPRPNKVDGLVVDLTADRESSWRSIQAIAAIIEEAGISRLRFRAKAQADQRDTPADVALLGLKPSEAPAAENWFAIEVPSLFETPPSPTKSVALEINKATDGSIHWKVGGAKFGLLKEALSKVRSLEIKRCDFVPAPGVPLKYVLATASGIRQQGRATRFFAPENEERTISTPSWSDRKKRVLPSE